MQADAIRVSGFVTEAQHAQMVELARRQRTTVGAIVQYSVAHALKIFQDHPRLASRIPPDGRRVSTTKEK